MSRHRDVRNYDYSDDYHGYDDVYGHSIDDDYYVSPSDAQYIYNRENSREQRELDIKEDDDGEIEQAVSELTDEDKLKLNSSVEKITEILGSADISRNEIIKVLLQFDFNIERSVNMLLEKSQAKDKVERKEKVIAPKTILPSDSDGPAVKIVAAGSKSTTSVTKGFDLSQRDATRLNVSRSNSPASGRSTPVMVKTAEPAIEEVKSTKKDSKANAEEQFKTERANSKEHLHMIVIGHVDAGKSTLMGHVLWELGQVNKKTMHKYEQESKKLGKQSFMYAWVLDETGEERNRGITMDVGRSQFETKTKLVTLLDAPGHKDFIPNMISGAGQADVALLVVDATRGEFETGFDLGGQTREHALLIRSLGVTQLAVAVNKMDTVSWSKERFDEIVQKLKTFLKQAGFREKDVTFVPCSGLTGQNLVQNPTENELLSWYSGPNLIDVIDNFKPPSRPITKPFRLSVNDTFKGTGSAFCISGRVETGTLNVGDKVMVCPNKDLAVVKGLSIDDVSTNVVFAGDQVVVAVSGIDMQNVSVGDILCDPLNPVSVTSKFQARIVVFNVTVPITKGYSVVLHHQSLIEPAVICKLVSQLNKSTGEVVKKHPRFLGNNTSAIVEIQVSRPIAIELYSDCKELGRVTLRVSGVTIAAGLVTKII